MSNDTSILVDNTVLLTQLDEFVSKLPSESYTLNNQLLKSGTIGAHTRHILDHYDAFLLAVRDLITHRTQAKSSSFDGASDCLSTVNYDERQRDLRIEQSPVFAGNHIQKIINQLRMQVTQICSICNSDTNPPINMICATNENTQAQPLVSSLARELVFLHSHTTHHMAIIRMLALATGHQVEAGFGKAASTKHFEQEIKDSENVHVQSQLA